MTRLPDTSLVTHDHRRVRFYRDLVRGRIVLMNLAYTRCTGICPTGFAKMRALQAHAGDALGRGIFLYTLTLDPEHDSPKVLAEARRDYGARRGWTFLTGRFEAVEEVRRALGLFDPDPRVDADRNQHAGLIVMGNDPEDRWSTVPLGFRTQRVLEAFDRVRLPVDRWPRSTTAADG